MIDSAMSLRVDKSCAWLASKTVLLMVRTIYFFFHPRLTCRWLCNVTCKSCCETLRHTRETGMQEKVEDVFGIEQTTKWIHHYTRLRWGNSIQSSRNKIQLIAGQQSVKWRKNSYPSYLRTNGPSTWPYLFIRCWWSAPSCQIDIIDWRPIGNNNAVARHSFSIHSEVSLQMPGCTDVR